MMTRQGPEEHELPSWRDGATKRAIIDFVARVTNEGSADYVAPAERIAVFDNDGTLWCEKPMYIQLDFLLRQLAAAAERDRALREQQPWKAAWEKDFAWFSAAVTRHYQGDDAALHQLLTGVMTLGAGQTPEAIEAKAKAFVDQASHPTLRRRYAECTYQPMIELLRYLEARGFTNYIASGGGRDFMRGFAQELYGIARERVIGSTVAYTFIPREGAGDVVQKGELDVVDDGPGKPIQIWNVIGRRPILAAGNSNGDLPMLQFCGGDALPALRLLVVHDDAEREFDYASGAEKVIEATRAAGWSTISIKEDWATVFAS